MEYIYKVNIVEFEKEDGARVSEFKIFNHLVEAEMFVTKFNEYVEKSDHFRYADDPKKVLYGTDFK